MKKLICTVFCAAVAAVQMSHAGVESKSFKEKVVVEAESCNFRDMEFQLDLFGAFAANPEFDTRGRTLNTGVGGGVGLNFFFARYFGIGVEGLWYDNGGSAEHMFIGNLFFRYPICKWNIAPYVMLGGGAGFDHELVGFGHVGGGVEWRFHKNIGLFADGRYFFGAPDALGMTRLGLRLAF